MAKFASRSPVFAVAVDVVVLTLRDRRLNALLVQRSGSMFVGKWTLPGLLVQFGEPLEDAARRALSDDAGPGFESVPLEQFHTYGEPGRDPRPERVVSVAWLALGSDLPDPAPREGADSAEWVEVTEAIGRDLASDHAQILTDALERVRNLLEHTTIATRFCPPTFTIPDLRRVYDAVWGTVVDPRNFQRKVLSAEGFVEETGEISRGRGRPAKVYRAGTTETLYPAILRK